MSNLRFEFQNSISINCLVYLRINPKLFDHHIVGFKLCQALQFAITNKSLDKEQAVKVTKDSTVATFVPPSAKEKDAMEQLFHCREQIKQAIIDKKLEVDEFDTKDSGEYRLVYETALKWINKIDLKQHSIDRRKDYINNLHLTVAALKDPSLQELNVLKKLSNSEAARMMRDLLAEKHNIHRDVKVFKDNLDDADKQIKD